MRRKFILALIVAGFLAMSSALNGPANAQIGLGRADVVSFTTATITGQLEIADGDASDPSIIFTSSDDGTGSGIFSRGADIVSFSSNGILAGEFNSASLRMHAGTAVSPSHSFFDQSSMGMFRIGVDNLGFSGAGMLVLDLEDTNEAGASANLATISSTLGIFNGSDTFNALSLELTNVNHTGTGNTVNLIGIAAITGDANSNLNAINIGTLTGTSGAAGETENLLKLGDGWDAFIEGPAVALGTLTWTTNSDKSALTASGTLKVVINGTLYHIQLYADS